MTREEQSFLAQVALGWFTIAPNGEIWRHVEFFGGDGAPTMHWTEPSRAETSNSGEGAYPRIMFWNMGERLCVDAHRIVWIYFNRRHIPATMEINHKDGDKSRHHPENLELVTHQENAIHAVRVLGRMGGEKNGQAKLTVEKVLEMRALWDAHAMSQPDLATRFGVAQTTVSRIVLRKKWRHVA